MFRRINVIKSLLGARHKSIILNQIESEKISKAERVKRLNFENKFLYGSTLKQKKNKKSQEIEPEELPDPDPRAQRNDLSSEIYWTCHHVPEIQDFTQSPKKPKKTKKTAKPKKESGKLEDLENQSKDPNWMLPEDELLKQPRKKNASPKKIIVVPQLPDSLSKLESLPAAKAKVKSSLEANFKLRNLKKEDEDDRDDELIPFDSDQIRQITQFPLVLKKSRVVNQFDKFVPEQSSILMPSVSRVLEATMPEHQRLALLKWKNLKISELGQDGFDEMQKSHLSRGKQFHECLQRHFKGETVIKSEIVSDVIQIWNSIEPLLERFQAPGILIEEKVNHPYLYYKGVVDCVSFHNSILSVIEWKKSDRQKKTINFTYDAPIQLTSYLGALNASRKEFLENPIKSGVVVVAYNDGQQADLFELNEKELRKYWQVWVGRLQDYWVRFRDRTLPERI